MRKITFEVKKAIVIQAPQAKERNTTIIKWYVDIFMKDVKVYLYRFYIIFDIMNNIFNLFFNIWKCEHIYAKRTMVME